jgi:hypothetical protein
MWLVCGVALQSHGFDPRSFHVEFVVEKVECRQFLLPESIVRPMLQIHIAFMNQYYVILVTGRGFKWRV